jgi:hypothetical protein
LGHVGDQSVELMTSEQETIAEYLRSGASLPEACKRAQIQVEYYRARYLEVDGIHTNWQSTAPHDIGQSWPELPRRKYEPSEKTTFEITHADGTVETVDDQGYFWPNMLETVTKRGWWVGDLNPPPNLEAVKRYARRNFPGNQAILNNSPAIFATNDGRVEDLEGVLIEHVINYGGQYLGKHWKRIIEQARTKNNLLRLASQYNEQATNAHRNQQRYGRQTPSRGNSDNKMKIISEKPGKSVSYISEKQTQNIYLTGDVNNYGTCSCRSQGTR